MRSSRLCGARVWGWKPGWIISGAFAHLWDSRFATFHVWQACKRRELYKENWIDWDRIPKSAQDRSIRLSRRATEARHVDDRSSRRRRLLARYLPPNHPGLCLLQRRDPAEMQILPTSREGLNLLATPERDARPSWITTVPDPAQSTGGGNIPGRVAAGSPAPAPSVPRLPFWMETAIKLGTRFVRVGAAAYPRASTEFEPGTSASIRAVPKRKHTCGQRMLRHLLPGMRLRTPGACRRV